MAKRIANETLQIEWVDTVKARLAAESLEIEYKNIYNFRRIATVMLQVEYIPNPSGRTQGPAAQ